jgi:hypothetical protein
LEFGSEALLIERHRLAAVAVEMDKGCNVFHGLLFHFSLVDGCVLCLATAADRQETLQPAIAQPP